MAKVYLIGAGPGDPELLTLKAVRAISESDVILYDQLINPEVLRHARSDAELVYVGKSMGDHTLPQAEINQLIVDLTQKYTVVSRVKGGDPLTFGRGGEEYEFILRHGIPCEIIPGITSAIASSALFGMPLTHREYASSVTFMTGHKKAPGEPSDFTALPLKKRTIVVYMGLSSLPGIMAELQKNPENAHTPVAIVEKVSRANQRILFGEVCNIADLVERSDVKSPALIVIGDVVDFARSLQDVRASVPQG